MARNMFSSVTISVVALLFSNTSTIHAYVNNGNTATSSTTPSINIMDWLPKNAFLPKSNLEQVKQQLIHTVLNLQLDMETIKGVIVAAPTTATTATTLDPKQEWVGWNSNQNDPNPNTIRTRKSTKDTVKSSHLLLQRSSDATPRLPIRNLQFVLDDSKVEDITATESNVVVGYSTPNNMAVASMLSKTGMKAKPPKSKNTIHSDTTTTIPMPGFNGQHPLLSSGVLPLTLQNCGEYVTLDKGVQSLPLSTTATTSAATVPQWEVIWKEQSPTGTIVCGIELQQPIRRNQEAMIPAGIMYISFPVWDGAQLIEYQKKKLQYDITSKLYSQERDMEIEKMTKSNNIFNKLMHYRNAFAAAENYSLQPHKTYQNVPTTLDDLIVVADHPNSNDEAGVPLYIVPKGMVRIVPTATMKQLTQTAPCGKQVVMNRMLWSSSSSNDADTKKSNDILHGTAKIVPPPAVIPLRIPKTEAATPTSSTTTISSDSSSVTDADTPFM